jgi:GNAT superfamily N-acetyltransferase
MMSELTYKDDFSGPRERASINRLLRDVFDVDVSPLEELNLWDPTYRAFAYLDHAGHCVANAAAFRLPLIINGERITAMGIQSVATRPLWRRRGLSHDLLERALRWCDENGPLTFLMTLIPAFYEPMGFRIMPQHAYAGAVPAVLSSQRSRRRLDLNTSGDRQLLARLLCHRAPVSAHFAVDGLPGAFVLNVLDESEFAVWHLPALDAVVVTAERPGGTICIVDVVADRIPSLAEVVGSFGVSPTRAEIHFPPDLLEWDGAPIQSDTSTVLMVRGDPGPLEPFRLPDTAAF